jgi:hypothetical protein
VSSRLALRCVVALASNATGRSPLHYGKQRPLSWLSALCLWALAWSMLHMVQSVWSRMAHERVQVEAGNDGMASQH